MGRLQISDGKGVSDTFLLTDLMSYSLLKLSRVMEKYSVNSDSNHEQSPTRAETTHGPPWLQWWELARPNPNGVPTKTETAFS